MIALVLAAYLASCPICGGHDAIVLSDGHGYICHDVEADTMPGDLYMIRPNDTITATLTEYIGYIY